MFAKMILKKQNIRLGFASLLLASALTLPQANAGAVTGYIKDFQTADMGIWIGIVPSGQSVQGVVAGSNGGDLCGVHHNAYNLFVPKEDPKHNVWLGFLTTLKLTGTKVSSWVNGCHAMNNDPNYIARPATFRIMD